MIGFMGWVASVKKGMRGREFTEPFRAGLGHFAEAFLDAGQLVNQEYPARRHVRRPGRPDIAISTATPSDSSFRWSIRPDTAECEGSVCASPGTGGLSCMGNSMNRGGASLPASS